MRNLRVDPALGAALQGAGGQSARFRPFARAGDGVFAGVLHLGPGGELGPHQAALPRALLVVRGSGWIRSSNSERMAVEAGDAVFFDSGESVDVVADQGLMAVVLEGERLHPVEA